jgi:hypothetical protein
LLPVYDYQVRNGISQSNTGSYKHNPFPWLKWYHLLVPPLFDNWLFEIVICCLDSIVETAKQYIMIKENQRLYVVIDNMKKSVEIFTTQVDASHYTGISVDTIQRAVRKGILYSSKGYIIGMSKEIHKNQKRVALGKSHWKRLKDNIPSSNYE